MVYGNGGQNDYYWLMDFVWFGRSYSCTTGIGLFCEPEEFTYDLIKLILNTGI